MARRMYQIYEASLPLTAYLDLEISFFGIGKDLLELFCKSLAVGIPRIYLVFLFERHFLLSASSVSV